MNKRFDQDNRRALEALKEEVLRVVAAIKKDPSRKKRILIGYITHYYEGVKAAVQKHGAIMPHYVIVADEPKFAGPAAVTEEVLARAKALNAEAIVSVEGFESREDLTDVVYHVTMSAPCLGVLGWVFKVKLSDGEAQILAEKPYLFESDKEAKTLGELMQELEEMAQGIESLNPRQ